MTRDGTLPRKYPIEVSFTYKVTYNVSHRKYHRVPDEISNDFISMAQVVKFYNNSLKRIFKALCNIRQAKAVGKLSGFPHTQYQKNKHNAINTRCKYSLQCRNKRKLSVVQTLSLFLS